MLGLKLNRVRKRGRRREPYFRFVLYCFIGVTWCVSNLILADGFKSATERKWLPCKEAIISAIKCLISSFEVMNVLWRIYRVCLRINSYAHYFEMKNARFLSACDVAVYIRHTNNLKPTAVDWMLTLRRYCESNNLPHFSLHRCHRQDVFKYIIWKDLSLFQSQLHYNLLQYTISL